MSWQDEFIPMLRVMINDVACATQTYSDDRLEEILVVSARYTVQDLGLTTDYAVTVSTRTISPDPSDTITDDNTILTNMTVLKAACLCDWSTFRTKALLAGVEAKCGPATISTLKHLDGFKELLTQGPCAAYESLLKSYNFGNTGIIMAILSPFVSNDFDPLSLNEFDVNNRDRMFS